MNDLNHQADAPFLAGHREAGERGSDINLRELFDVLWSGKWIVAAVTLIAVLLSIAYAVTVQPIYQSNGLVQIEKDESGAGKALDQLSSLIGGAPTDASAEIAILKSRMVLGTVVESLKLYIKVEPIYFPVVGKAIAWRYRSDGLNAPVLGLHAFAWGGESIKVTAFDVPESMHNSSFVLEVTEQGFTLKQEKLALVVNGSVGQRLNVNTRVGNIGLFVQDIKARPGVRFRLTRVALPTILEQVALNLTVSEQPRDSGVLAIQVEDANPRFAAQLVNEIENAYLKQNVERRSAQAEQSLEFLKRQLPTLRENVDSAQASLNSYQLQRGTVDVQQETALVLKRTVDLETQRLSLMQERDAALLRYTSQHPVVTALNERVRGVEREITGVRKQVELLPQTQQEILSLMRDLEVNTQLYTALLNSAQELQVTKAGTVGNVRIIDYGLAPLYPVKPRKKVIVALGLVAGLMMGVLMVFSMRAFLRGVDRPEEVERALGLPTYASIPYSQSQRRVMQRLRQEKGAGGMMLAGLDSNDLAVEALRSLRTSLHFAMLEASNNVVMLTGPIAALGKSFVSINLGALLAMSGKRILVIDADMRRGRLHLYAGVNQKPGLSDYVAGTVNSLEAIVHSTAVKGLDFVAGGTRPPNPSEILMSAQFDQALKELSARYDYVLVDTPPVLPVTDAAVIGRLAGTTLLVLKSAEHPLRAIEETVRRLRQAGVPVRGVIFNQVGARVGSYGYGSYGYSYGYSTYGYSKRTD